MKPALLLISLCSLAIPAGAQPGRPTLRPASDVSSLRTITIQLNGSRDPGLSPAQSAPNPGFAHSPFTHFEVLDERPDTARIGVHGNLPMHSHFFDRQLIFSKPAHQEIAAWLNRHCTHPGASSSVLVILRCLWLSDTDPYTPSPDQYSTFHAHNCADARTHIRLKAEIYARRNDQYLPLLRIDTLEPTRTVIYNPRAASYIGWEKDLAAMLRDLAENAALAANPKEDGSRWISREDIRRFNLSRFDIPIFDSVALTRGVYTSFEEFRNNAPSIHDFEVRPNNGHLALYLRNGDGTSYYTHNVWGYCNGEEVFIMRDGLLHLLRKDGNSFYFYGIDIASVSNPPLNAFSGYPEQHCLYIIDMDSGQFY